MSSEKQSSDFQKLREEGAPADDLWTGFKDNMAKDLFGTNSYEELSEQQKDEHFLNFMSFLGSAVKAIMISQGKDQSA